MTTKWDWEYFNGGYTIHREDATQQVWFQAPNTKCGNVAADALCEWLTKLEVVNAQQLEALMAGLAMLNGLDPALEVGVRDAFHILAFRDLTRAVIAAAGGQP